MLGFEHCSPIDNLTFSCTSWRDSSCISWIHDFYFSLKNSVRRTLSLRILVCLVGLVDLVGLVGLVDLVGLAGLAVLAQEHLIVSMARPYLSAEPHASDHSARN